MRDLLLYVLVWSVGVVYGYVSILEMGDSVIKFPPITIIILTFDRPLEVRRTIDALAQHLTYQGQLHFLIADNTSPGNYASDLLHDYREWINLGTDFRVIVNPAGDRNWGSNANYALSQCTTDLIIQLEDDFILKSPIDLTPLAALLLLNSGIGLIRLGGIMGHVDLTAVMRETDISTLLPQYRQGMGMLGRVNYWQLSPYCEQLYVYSNHVQLKHKRFHLSHGLYPEGLGLGACEEAMAHQVKDNLLFASTPQIAVPLELVVTQWDHVGVSWRNDIVKAG